MDGYYSGCFDIDGTNKLTNKTMTALRAALAQQEQEPVAPYAWMAVGGTIWRRKTSEDDVPLYTAPPRRKWQSLSEEEIHDCFQQRHKDKATERRMIALAIEQALRSKNK
jgi:hypothetical protein